MHFDFLIEDSSGKKALDILVPAIIGINHSFTIHSYRGIGRIPKNMKDTKNASKRILLDNLPKLLKGYGRTYHDYPDNYRAMLFIICDLDDHCLRLFRDELLCIWNACNPKPETKFCLAIEEGEAWLLGDLDAIKRAYPAANQSVLESYINDKICGTWETLADAVYPGGSKSLIEKGKHAVGTEKSKWAENICPFMNVDDNKSPSFQYFRSRLEEPTRQ